MKRALSYLLFFTLGFSWAYAQQEFPLITNVPNRTSISLDGKWHYIIDPYETGYYNYRLQPHDETINPGSGAYFVNAKPKNKGERVEYDFDASPTLEVPGGWNFQAPELNYYEGGIWYKRNIEYAPKEGKRTFLYFGAVNYECHVYLNGTKIGKHTGGFGPFNFEVTNQLKEGKNFVVVYVNNTRKPEAVPTVNTDWWNHGGITRSVKLIEVPKTFIQDFKVQLKKGAASEVEGFVQLNGVTSPKEVKISIPELKVEETVSTNSEGLASFNFPVKKLQRWSPENPKLYEVIIEAGEDKTTDKIGFRTIEVVGTDILLNGEKIFLRGVCHHEENTISGERITNETEARMVYGWAKDLNANFLRLAHYPHNEYMARVADEMGFLLWEEVPVYWTIHWDNKETLANAKNQLEEIINRDQNRASVIIWSVANETPVSESRLSFLRALISTARSKDNTRLISAAMEVDHKSDTEKEVHDPLGEFSDVVSFNQYVGWYGGDVEKFSDIKWKIKYNKPTLVSEWGAGALYGFRGDDKTIWTEDYQARFYEHTLKGIMNIPYLSGFTPWLLTDFRSPKRNLPVIQDGWNRKGIIGEGGQKKQAFYVLRDYYQAIKEGVVK